MKSKLESLAPRLEKVSSSASEAEEMVSMENNLKELEAWLVSSGKFYSNQHILRQIQAHSVRRGEGEGGKDNWRGEGEREEGEREGQLEGGGKEGGTWKGRGGGV